MKFGTLRKSANSFMERILIYTVVELQPINLRLAAMKELVAKWLVEMAEYISSNPQFIINGSRCAGFLKHWTATEKILRIYKRSDKSCLMIQKTNLSIQKRVKIRMTLNQSQIQMYFFLVTVIDHN